MFLELCLHCLALSRGDGGFCSAPTRAVLRPPLDTHAAGREATAAAIIWPQTSMPSLKSVTLRRRFRLAHRELTAKDYKSQVDRAREAEGASNTRARVALRSCGASDAARNGNDERSLWKRFSRVCQAIVSTIKITNRIVKCGSHFHALNGKVFSEKLYCLLALESNQNNPNCFCSDLV